MIGDLNGRVTVTEKRWDEVVAEVEKIIDKKLEKLVHGNPTWKRCS